MNLVERLKAVLEGKAVHVDGWPTYIVRDGNRFILRWKIDNSFFGEVEDIADFFRKDCTNYQLYTPEPTEDEKRAEFVKNMEDIGYTKKLAELLWDTFWIHVR